MLAKATVVVKLRARARDLSNDVASILGVVSDDGGGSGVGGWSWVAGQCQGGREHELLRVSRVGGESEEAEVGSRRGGKARAKINQGSRVKNCRKR